MRKDNIFVPMDDRLENGLHTPGNLPSQFDWKFFDSRSSLHGCGTHGRLDHSYYLYQYASVLPDNSLIVEIGTGSGGSAIAMGMGIREKNSKIITIDPGLLSKMELIKRRKELNRYEIEINNLDMVKEIIKEAKLERYIFIIPDTSENALKKWDGRPIDMIHIDGSSKYEDTKIDCEWLQYIKRGGIAVFDDWVDEVQRAMKEYIGQHPEWELLTSSTDQPDGYPWKTVFWRN